jgi:Fur family peroxide stress response transcriptional regulator
MAIQLPKGIKRTPQRLAILRYLEGNRDHPSAEEIYRDIKRDFPTMSFATVYNTLEALRAHGQVIQLSIDPKRRRYDPDTTMHHHLICRRCSRIVDIHIDFDISLPEEFNKGYSLIGSHIEFYGICPECKEDRDEDNKV